MLVWRRGQQRGAARCIRVCGQSRVHVASQQGNSHVLSRFMSNMQWNGQCNVERMIGVRERGGGDGGRGSDRAVGASALVNQRQFVRQAQHDKQQQPQ